MRTPSEVDTPTPWRKTITSLIAFCSSHAQVLTWLRAGQWADHGEQVAVPTGGDPGDDIAGLLVAVGHALQHSRQDGRGVGRWRWRGGRRGQSHAASSGSGPAIARVAARTVRPWRAGGAGRRRGVAQNGTSSKARLEGLDGGELAGSWWASLPSAGAGPVSRRSSVTSANRKLAATSSASTSTSERRWPSGVS